MGPSLALLTACPRGLAIRNARDFVRTLTAIHILFTAMPALLQEGLPLCLKMYPDILYAGSCATIRRKSRWSC